MTCDDCQAIVIDSARGVEVDRALRDEARRHAALCSRCGEQQQEQQWLTAQLRAIAAVDATRQAPARVEIAALAAWRAEYASASASAAAAVDGNGRHGSISSINSIGIGNTGSGSAARRWMMRSVVWAGLAAAAMAVLFVWPAWRAGSGGANASIVASGPNAAPRGPRLEGKQASAQSGRSRTATVRSGSAKSSSAGTDAGRNSNSESNGERASTAAGAAQPIAGQPTGSQPTAEQTVAERTATERAIVEPPQAAEPPSSATAPAGAARPRTVVSPESVAPGRAAAVVAGATATTRDTEFQALPYVEPLRPTEARHVMRVSLTSGDEMILGVLPKDRRNGQAFEADVLVGEDGVARAIRVIR